MRKIAVFLVMLVLWSASLSTVFGAQVVIKDDFSDGDLISNPAWKAHPLIHGRNNFTVVNDLGRKAIRALQRSSAGSLFRLPPGFGQPVVLDTGKGPVSVKFEMRFKSPVRSGNNVNVYLMTAGGKGSSVAIIFFQGGRIFLQLGSGDNRRRFASAKPYYYDPGRYYSYELICHQDGSFEVLVDGRSVLKTTPDPGIHQFESLVFFDPGRPGKTHFFTNIVVTGEPREKKVRYFRPGQSPLLTIPQAFPPPKIDGRIGEDEWRSAAAVSGFFDLSGALSDRQTVVYASFDEENLYLAFRSVQQGKFREGKTGRDINFGNQEAVEVWIQPPGKGWFQFVGDPAGGTLELNSKEGISWNGTWQFKSRVEDSGETVGGVLTFTKKIWTVEVSIPFKILGVSPPRDGKMWRMNFCRDFSVEPGKAKRASDWTTWSPVKGSFTRPAEFGYVRFDRQAPGFQLTQLGDLKSGNIALKGSAFGSRRGKIAIEVAVRTRGKERKVILKRLKKLELSPGKPSGFSIPATFKVAGRTEAELLLSAQDLSRKVLLAQSEISFTALSSFRLKCVPVPSQGILYVEVDVERLAGLPEKFSGKVEIYAAGEARARLSVPVKGLGPKSLKREIKLDISALKPGEYFVKGTIQDAGGKVLASTGEPLVVPERPAWLGNKLGISDKVLPPWKPVEVGGNQVIVTQRKYRLEDIGLPEQVTSLGEDIFAAPAKLKVIIGGKEVRWNSQPLKLLSKKDGRVVWEINGQAGPLTLKGKLTIEFDGFALWEVTIESRKAITVDSLFLEFPFRKARSLYARGYNATEHAGGYYACLYNTKTPSPSDITGSHFSSTGWVWPEAWVDEIWVGDDFRGFSVMNETREYLKGKKRTEIERSKKANTLKIHLVDGPYRLKEPLKYKYAWQATPVKPRPENPKIWHTTYGRSKEEGFLKRVYVATPTYWALKYISYPALFLPKRAVDRKNAIYREAGVKVVPYFAVQAITTEAPELKPFLKEWERYPCGSIGGPRGGSEIASVTDKSFADFIVYATRKIVDDLGLDGLYLDVSGAQGDSNHYHGSGWWDKENQKWQPTVNIFATRAVYKRLYNVLKSGGRDGVLFRHVMPVAAVAGFVDVVTQGEEWCREGTKQYDRLTPDIFRTKEMRIQYGTPYTWYVFHHYGRGLKYGGRVPLAAILAYSLPHHVLPTDGDSGMWPVWDVMDGFWTSSEFIPYWDPNTPIRIKEENVLGSLYLKKAEKKALLVIANWNKKPRTVEVRIDLKKLGLGNRLKFTRALTHPIRDPWEPPGSDPMKNTPLVYRNGYLHLELAGRDLEVILVESE